MLCVNYTSKRKKRNWNYDKAWWGKPHGWCAYRAVNWGWLLAGSPAGAEGWRAHFPPGEPLHGLLGLPDSMVRWAHAPGSQEREAEAVSPFTP